MGGRGGGEQAVLLQREELPPSELHTTPSELHRPLTPPISDPPRSFQCTCLDEGLEAPGIGAEERQRLYHEAFRPRGCPLHRGLVQDPRRQRRAQLLDRALELNMRGLEGAAGDGARGEGAVPRREREEGPKPSRSKRRHRMRRCKGNLGHDGRAPSHSMRAPTPRAVLRALKPTCAAQSPAPHGVVADVQGSHHEESAPSAPQPHHILEPQGRRNG